MAISKKDTKNDAVFQSYFSKLEDPRRTTKGNHLYSLDEIILLCISAVISGADTWTSIQTFGNIKLDWLRSFLPFENGIPSHDVLGKLFSRICPESFSRCFSDWVASITTLTKGEVVAIDGKRICGSEDQSVFRSAFHVVSAFACENEICLGQKAVDHKSNEIKAIPELLKLLKLKGCIISIDAMGCQTDIAKEIIENKADYILAVKNNQKSLHEQVEKMFSIHSTQEHIQKEINGGRIEVRKCEVIEDLSFMDDIQKWTSLKSVVKISSTRTIKKTDITTYQERYYITSLSSDPEKINKAIRQHWSIENKLHWTLDVVFKEDASLKKKGFSALNFNTMTKVALALVDKEKSTKKSKPSKILTAALDDNYRKKILLS